MNYDKKILVIEDDLAILQLIKDIFENEGCKVFTAKDGKTGIQLAKENLPDLIICDIMMPTVDGYQVKEALSENSDTILIPFIFLSALSEKKDIRKGMEIGADDYITKPFKIDEIKKAVEARLRKKELFLLKKNSGEKNENNSLEKVDEDSHIIVEADGKPLLIKVNNIVSVTALNEFSIVNLNDKRSLKVRRLLKAWEELLPPKIFYRIHRSTIININYVKKVEKWFNNSLAIHLNTIDEPLFASRRYTSNLKSKLYYK